MRAVRKKLEGSGLQISESPQDIVISNPRSPENGSFTVDYEGRYLAWEHVEYQYWNFDDDIEDDGNSEFIAKKITEVLAR